MVDISPGTALLIALGNQFAASRANAPQGNLGAGLPGLTGQNGEGSPGSPGGLAAGAVGGGVPSTATTGSSVANALAGGGGLGGLSAGDPLAQQVERNFFNQRETFSGQGPPAPGTAEGEISPAVMAAIMSGNPIAMALAVSRAVAGQGEPADIGTQGIPFAERETGQDAFGRTTGLQPAPSNNIGSLGISFADRDRFGPAGPGRSPSRGTVSNAGR